MKRSELEAFDATQARDALAKVQSSLAVIVPLVKKLTKRRNVLDMEQRRLLVLLWEYEHSHEAATVDDISAREINRLASIMQSRVAGLMQR